MKDKHFGQELAEKSVAASPHLSQYIEAVDEGNLADGTHVTSLQPKDENNGVCDFCSEPTHGNPATFISKQATVGILIGLDGTKIENISSADWAACSPCTILITAKDKDGLVKRSVRKFMEQNEIISRGFTEKNIRENVERVQKVFWDGYLEEAPRG